MKNIFVNIINNIKNIRFDKDISGIEGWITDNEKSILYNFAKNIEGNILEIGSWVGLSTSCICYGIKDSNIKKTFITCELNPKKENYKKIDNGIGFYKNINDNEPMWITDINNYNKNIEHILEYKGGVIGKLKDNLKNKNLIDFVEIIEGDFDNLNNFNFNFIFVDTLHTQNEILKNANKIKKFINNETIVICHDVYYRGSNNLNLLKEIFLFKDFYIVDSMLIF